MRVHVEFSEPAKPRPRLLAEAALVFEGGRLDGLRLIGFGVWTSARDGDCIVSLPAQAEGYGEYRQYHEYIRAEPGNPEPRRALRAWLLAEYEQWRRVHA